MRARYKDVDAGSTNNRERDIENALRWCWLGFSWYGTVGEIIGPERHLCMRI